MSFADVWGQKDGMVADSRLALSRVVQSFESLQLPNDLLLLFRSQFLPMNHRFITRGRRRQVRVGSSRRARFLLLLTQTREMLKFGRLRRSRRRLRLALQQHFTRPCNDQLLVRVTQRFDARNQSGMSGPTVNLPLGIVRFYRRFIFLSF